MKTIEIVNRFAFQIKKYSPEILISAGVIGVIASTVLACKATTKISTILEKAKEDIDKIHDCDANESLEEYTHEDAMKDLTIVYVQTGVKLVKLYAPSLLLGTISIVSILASNKILHKRNIALAAAYATIDKGFKEYRKRIIERLDEETERELKYNIKAKKFEETVVDENGKKEKIEKIINEANLDVHSDYSRFFDAASRNWEKDPEYNLIFLRAQQQYANDLLKSRGHLFLNEVYDMLDIPRTAAGQIVGWIYDPKCPVGDNFVDFGIYDTKNRYFVNGYERDILLDFNVDGNIYEDLYGVKLK